MQEKERRDKEAAELDDEAARRRQRVALWQEQRRAAQQAEEAEAQKQAAASEQWTLDDDIANEYGQASQTPHLPSLRKFIDLRATLCANFRIRKKRQTSVHFVIHDSLHDCLETRHSRPSEQNCSTL